MIRKLKRHCSIFTLQQSSPWLSQVLSIYISSWEEIVQAVGFVCNILQRQKKREVPGKQN